MALMLRVLVCVALPAIVKCWGYTTWPGVHRITSWDGVQLQAYTEKPLTIFPHKKFPLVVFINSWATPGIEYLIKTIRWASHGYVCVEYESRGWYSSGGRINVASSDDIKDVSAVIDWALKKFHHVDSESIAVAGISYGSMMSQLAAAADPRIRAVLALSGGSNLFDELYWQKSIARPWGSLLVESGKFPLVGREGANVSKMYHRLLKHKEMDIVAGWCFSRSMENVLKQIHVNRPAIYMSHQHQDNLFHSDVELRAWHELQVPKKLDLSQGTHASAEILGLLGVRETKAASDHIWNNALRWLDRWLKGVHNGVDSEDPVNMQLGGAGAMSPYVSFPSWPPPPDISTSVKLFMHPRASRKFGVLALNSTTAEFEVDKISYGTAHEQTMSSGYFFLSDLFKVLVPITAQLNNADTRHSVIYKSAGLPSPSLICGVPQVSGLTVVPSTRRFQIVLYMYDVDSNGLGKLIAHGTRVSWEEDGVEPGVRFLLPDIRFHTCCYEVAAGRALALGINMHDGLYAPVGVGSSISFHYANQPRLHLPIVRHPSSSGHIQEVLV